MKYCMQCDRQIRWWDEVLGNLLGRCTNLGGVSITGREFCSDPCWFRYADAEDARLLQEEIEETREATEECAWQERKKATEERREKAAEAKRAKLQKERAERAKNLRQEPQKAQELQNLKERERELDAIKQPFLEAITSDPLDAASYVRLADFLVEATGIQKVLGQIQEMDPVRLGGLLHLLSKPVHASIWLANSKHEPAQELERKLQRGKRLLVEAREAYFKAIAIGIELDSYASACHKLAYVFISFLSLADPEHLTFKDEASHYAREAEKDLRQHLRKKPDDTEALQKMALAIAIYQKNHNTRRQRLTSVNARVMEAETRQELGTGPRSDLRVPGAPDSPYPDNWDEIRLAVKNRDAHRCTQRGAVNVELHVHHVVPLSKGGTNELDNLVTLCDICHREEHSG